MIHTPIPAFTGHRPAKLGSSGPRGQARLAAFAAEFIDKLIARAPPEFILVGMAQGWDLAIARAAKEAKLPYIAAVAFDGQEALWPAEAQIEYRYLLRHAEQVKVICPAGPTAAWKYHERNQFMVDKAERVIALWDGSPSGTAQTIHYAQAKKKPIKNLWPQWQQFVHVEMSPQIKTFLGIR